MENIRDLAVEGWMSQTSRKGKGPGKTGEEQEVVKLAQKKIGVGGRKQWS